jgi:hypothetical protein
MKPLLSSDLRPVGTAVAAVAELIVRLVKPDGPLEPSYGVRTSTLPLMPKLLTPICTSILLSTPSIPALVLPAPCRSALILSDP